MLLKNVDLLYVRSFANDQKWPESENGKQRLPEVFLTVEKEKELICEGRRKTDLD